MEASTKNELQHNGFKIHLSNQIEEQCKKNWTLFTTGSDLLRDDVGGIRLIGKKALLFTRIIDNIHLIFPPYKIHYKV